VRELLLPSLRCFLLFPMITKVNMSFGMQLNVKFSIFNNHYIKLFSNRLSTPNIQSFFTIMDGDQEDRKPLDKGKEKERAQSLPENAGEASTTPPTLRSISSLEGNQSVSSNHPLTSASRRPSRCPASQVREELEGGRRRSLAPGNDSGPNEGTLRRINVPPCLHIGRC
jgi:hypothetical protein